MVAAKDVKLLLLGKRRASPAAGRLRLGAARRVAARFACGGTAWGGGALRGTDFTAGSHSALRSFQAVESPARAPSSNR